MLISRKFKRACKRKFNAALAAIAIVGVVAMLPYETMADATTSPVQTTPQIGTQNFQTSPVGVLSEGNTNSISATSTNTLSGFGAVADVSGYDSVGITIQFTPSSSMSGNSSLQVLAGPNASIIGSNPQYNLLIPGNGTSQVTWFTNLNVGSAGVICLTNWGNSNSFYLSNLVVKVTLKAPRRQDSRR